MTLRSDICTEIDQDKNSEFQEKAIDFVYGDLETKSTMLNWKDYASKRAILAPTNDIVSQINDTCMEQLPGYMFVLPDISRCINPDDATNYTSDLIDTFEAPGVPSALLKLKKGAVVLLLRNLCIQSGLVNGTRLIVSDIINGRLIKAMIATGEKKGNVVLLPRIPMKPADFTRYDSNGKSSIPY